jgi:hypothetical protein
MPRWHIGRFEPLLPLYGALSPAIGAILTFPAKIRFMPTDSRLV